MFRFIYRLSEGHILKSEGGGRGSGWGTHINLLLIHVSVWQKPLQYCKVISLQLIKINEKKYPPPLIHKIGGNDSIKNYPEINQIGSWSLGSHKKKPQIHIYSPHGKIISQTHMFLPLCFGYLNPCIFLIFPKH